MPNLLATDAPRVVMVSSESHRSPRRLDFDRFPLTEDGYKGLIAYGQAKLCNVFFARSLQARYGDRGLTTCSLHPGTLITTDIGRNSTFVSVLMKLVSADEELQSGCSHHGLGRGTRASGGAAGGVPARLRRR